MTSAPSWSWAAVDRPIDPWVHPIARPLVYLKSAETTPKDNDPFGQLLDGRLVLIGALFKIIAFGDMEPSPSTYFNIDQYRATSVLVLDDWNNDSRRHDTYFIPLAEIFDTSKIPKYAIFGLLLQEAQLEGSDETVFQRIGLAVVSLEDGDLTGRGMYLKNWVSPPWRDGKLQDITII